MSFQTKLAIAYGTAMLILCAMVGVSFRNAKSVEETRQWGRHSSQVVHRIEAFHAALERAEEIAYFSAGANDTATRQAFATSRSLAEQAEKDIRSLTSDNLTQQHRLDVFEPQLSRYFALLNASFEAQPAAHERAQPAGSGAERAHLATSIGAMLAAMNAEEDRLALVRRQAIDSGLKRSSYLLMFGYASAILLSAVCFVILRTELLKRSAVQRELQRAQEGLEVRVAERTEELRATNQALQVQIDERKRAERQVQQLNASLEMRVEQRTLELTQAVRELDAFCYSVAHDLRAPLRHVDGFARILETEYLPQLTGQASHYLGRVVDGVNQMGRLIDDLLELSRISRKKLTRRYVSTQEMVERVIGNFRVMPEARTVEWRVDPLPSLNCDAALLEVVLTNLISNAVKFTRDARPRVIQFGTTNVSDATVFFIRDNGIGFDPQYADKLFGVFQRLHRQEDFAGTGIGLATVQRIVQRHGGTIRAESQPGSGSTFYFTMGPQSIVAAAISQEEVNHVRV